MTDPRIQTAANGMPAFQCDRARFYSFTGAGVALLIVLPGGACAAGVLSVENAVSFERRPREGNDALEVAAGAFIALEAGGGDVSRPCQGGDKLVFDAGDGTVGDVYIVVEGANLPDTLVTAEPAE